MGSRCRAGGGDPTRLAGPAGELPGAGLPAGGAAGRAGRRGPRPGSCSAAWAARRWRRRSSAGRRACPLVVLDTTDPGQVSRELDGRARAHGRRGQLASRGGTVETDSQRRAFLAAFAEPGSTKGAGALRRRHRPRSRRSETAPPWAPGRCSSPTRRSVAATARCPPSGWCPRAGRGRRRRAARRGRGAGRHLADRATPRSSSGLALGAGPRRAGQARPRGRRLGHRRLRRLGRAAHRRVDRQGGPRHPARRRRGRRRAGRLRRGRVLAVVGARPATPPPSSVTGPLGAQFLAWEYATAVAGRVLGINPFDQPNVTRARRTPPGSSARGCPRAARGADGAIEIRGSGGVLDGVDLSSHDGWLALDALWRRSRRAATSR